MSAGFTPGPWWLNHDEDDHENEWELLGRGEETVCALQHFGRKSTAEANARLIAAAPELYEACADALAGWRYIRKHHGDLYGVGWDRVEQSLTDTIAKASGDIPSGRSG